MAERKIGQPENISAPDSNLTQVIPEHFMQRSLRWISKHKHEIVGTVIGLGASIVVYGGGTYLANQLAEANFNRFAINLLFATLVTTAPLILVSPLLGKEISKSVFR